MYEKNLIADVISLAFFTSDSKMVYYVFTPNLINYTLLYLYTLYFVPRPSKVGYGGFPAI